MTTQPTGGDALRVRGTTGELRRFLRRRHPARAVAVERKEEPVATLGNHHVSLAPAPTCHAGAKPRAVVASPKPNKATPGSGR